MFEKDVFKGTGSGLLRKLGKRLPTTADVLESDDELLVLIDMPGCEKDDIELLLDDGVLKASAQRGTGSEEGYDTVRKARPGSLKQSVPLPSEVDAETATARYDDGLLKVRLEKIRTRDDAEYTDVEIDKSGRADFGEAEETESDEPETESEEGDDDYPDSLEDLENTSYRRLQEIAKDLDIKANIKKEEMIDRIADELDLDG